jgi:CheY-like chemotaxis protein
VVDDNSAARESLARRLRAWGLQVSAFAAATPALEALRCAADRGEPFQIALIDREMPELDGVGLGRAIRTTSMLQATRTVLLTPIGVKVERDGTSDTDFDSYAEKPIRRSELKAAIEVALLPRGQALAVRLNSSRMGRIDEAEGRFAGSRARILVAEDNITNQQVALGILRKFGLMADAVANGAEALRAFALAPYDLVLMDVQMPELDGLAATKALREVTRGQPKPPVIVAMTAHAMRSDAEECFAAGMDDYVTKPVRPQRLAEVFEKWLGPSSGPAGSTRNSSLRSNAAVSTSQLGTMTSTTPLVVFDEQDLVNRSLGDRDLARNIAHIFLEDSSAYFEKLDDLLLTADATVIESLAHKIKGSALNIGGVCLGEHAFVLERLAKSGDLAGVRAEFDEFKRRHSDLRSAIELSTLFADEERD